MYSCTYVLMLFCGVKMNEAVILAFFTDYALMGEHHEVAQFMIEQGGLSITGIQDIAACKVQVSMFSTTSIA